MKKFLAFTLSVILTLSIAGVTLAYDLVTSFNVKGEITAGYLKLNNYGRDDKTLIKNYNYGDGAFWSQLKDLDLNMINSMKITDTLRGEIVSQFQIYEDQESPAIENCASAVKNFNLTYNPGWAKFMFDAKGQEVTIGIPSNPYSDPLLRLNVARLVAKYGEKEVDANMLHPEEMAKQLTTEIPFPVGRFVSVFSLEPESDGDAFNFVGGFTELKLGKGTYALGYQAKMDDKETYLVNINSDGATSDNRMPDYWVLAIDYHFSKNTRLQIDYSTRDKERDGIEGYYQYWRPIEIINTYPRTPFRITGLMNSVLTLNNFTLRTRLIKTVTEGDWDKCWIDGSYYFKPFTIGVNYRNWVFSTEDGANGDNHMTELYMKHDLFPSWRDSLKVFIRSDHSFGAVINVNLY